jgi:hypothetical protein
MTPAPNYIQITSTDDPDSNSTISIHRIQALSQATSVILFVGLFITAFYFATTADWAWGVILICGVSSFCRICWAMLGKRMYWSYLRRSAGDEEMGLMDEQGMKQEDVEDEEAGRGRGRSTERR